MKLFSVIDRFYFSIISDLDATQRTTSGQTLTSGSFFPSSDPKALIRTTKGRSKGHQNERIEPSRWRPLFQVESPKSRCYRRIIRRSDRSRSFSAVQEQTNDIIIYFYRITLTLSNFPNDFVRHRLRREAAADDPEPDINIHKDSFSLLIRDAYRLARLGEKREQNSFTNSPSLRNRSESNRIEREAKR
jgi:hypothetical protein